MVSGARGPGDGGDPSTITCLTLDQSPKAPLGLLCRVGLIKRGRVAHSWLTSMVVPAFAVGEDGLSVVTGGLQGAAGAQEKRYRVALASLGWDL